MLLWLLTAVAGHGFPAWYTRKGLESGYILLLQLHHFVLNNVRDEPPTLMAHKTFPPKKKTLVFHSIISKCFFFGKKKHLHCIYSRSTTTVVVRSAIYTSTVSAWFNNAFLFKRRKHCRYVRTWYPRTTVHTSTTTNYNVYLVYTLAVSAQPAQPIFRGGFCTVSHFVAQGLLDFDPFARIDEEGVGGLISTALEKARAKQPDIKVRSLYGIHTWYETS